ncbi:hypothetical protein BEE12_16075 [Pantoea agglomerans]|uniref:hypothetical protein n=1 Tax=Enterobacter agglomerans TaxID=549 RepID=UPI00083DC708|nr:hypothetical protein [Pantoea agglomerans]AOE41234.1 hypothetical protein BEE12_16075 [Pantoea agglomerans]
MAHINHIQTNFTAGEMNTNLAGRVDAERYAAAAKQIFNGWVRVSGGVERRQGTRFINEARDNSGKIKLIPFVFNRDQSYCLELTDGKMRIYQSGEMIVNPDKTPYEVDTGIPASAFNELSYAQSADTMFFANPFMRPRRLQRFGQTDWRFTDIPFVTLPFDVVRDSPSGWARLSANDYLGQIVTLELFDDETGAAYTGNGFDATQDIGNYITIFGGLVLITKVDSKSKITGQLRRLMTTNPAEQDTTTGKATKWPYAPETNWKRNQAVWSDSMGWPAVVALHQQRLVFAGSNSFPLTVWASRTGDYYNFELGALDDDSWSYKLDSDQVNPIIHMFSMNSLIVISGANEYIITGPNNIITPTQVNVKSPSAFGAALVRPVRVGTELIFIQRGDRKVIAMTYDQDSAAPYEANEMSLLAEHMTADSRIIDCTKQQQPDNLIHFVREDGRLISVTLHKQTGVIAWTLNDIGAPVISIATIPRSDGTDDTYLAVMRNVNNVPTMLIEHFAPGVYTDSSIIGQIEGTNPPQIEWSRLDHLEGQTVDIVADGVPQPRAVVAGGKITLTRPASIVMIGLPYTTRIVTQKPETGSAFGTSQAARSSTVELWLRFLKTTGCTVNGEIIPFRKFGLQVLDKPAPLYTGDLRWQGLGWQNNELTIEQNQPLPFHLLAVIRVMAVN